FDPRLSKEIYALIEGGFAVTLLCWDRSGKKEINEENSSNYREIKLKFKAPYGPKMIPFIPIWWIFVLGYLLNIKTDYIHVININCIIPAYFASKIRNKKFIYEMYDTHENRIKFIPKIIRNLIIRFNKFFMNAADAIIIVDESRIDELKGIPNNNVVVIYNSPPDILDNYKDNKKPNKLFTIFFAGGLEKYKSLEAVIQIVKKIEGTKLVIAGFGSLSNEIKMEYDKNPAKIEFIGKINYDEVLKRSISADLLFSLYNSKVPSFKFASSNKLFEAMMCKKPILISKGTSMVNIVKEHECGIIVDCENINEIQEAIVYLKDNPEKRYVYGENGRKAYDNFFSWDMMTKKLISLYNNLEK
ncbi:MAG: glycosyltransferase family 4 protein, partial [Methanobacterium sp.]|nr:glycosyltransferase family 4 protein [Methanobacterium sp.]